MAIQIRFRGALTTTVCRCPEKHKSMQAPTPTLQRVRSLTRAHHTIPEDQLSKQRTEKISAVADTQKYSGTYAYPTTNTQPYASSPYGTARSTQQAMYGTTSAFVDTQVNDYKRWAPSQSETYADVKNNLTWTYGEGKSSIHTVDPVTKENLTAHYYSEEYLRTWAFYRQSGEFVHIG
ncbi:unnamed protein product [Alternaria alternata]